MERLRHYIDGRFEDGAQAFETLDPATGTPWALVADASAADVDRAVRAADRAFTAPAWAGLTATARGKLIARLADLVAEAAPRLARLETRDTGKIIRETGSQIAYVADYYRYYAGLADKIEGAHLPIDKPDMEVWLRREPVGVVAAIVPWNSQLFLSAVKLGPALAAGCTVVVKASEDGPAAMLEFARLVDQAGFPPGVVNILTGGPEAGHALTTHPLVAHIAFTGGPETARHIVRASAENLSRTSLELGGKSPFIVFDDADLDAAVEGAMVSKFRNGGQTCVCANRILVQSGIHDAFVAALAARVDALKVGSGTEPGVQIGPMINPAAIAKIGAHIDDALSKGATRATATRDLGQQFADPTVLVGAATEMQLASEETFGPVAPIFRFETEDEALAIANGTPFGLAAYFFTRDIARAFRFGEALEAGLVGLNTGAVSHAEAPFGGVKASGLGREGAQEGIEEYLETKAFHFGGL